jgi:hypothetical protein
MIHYHKTRQNTVRIARTIDKVQICRYFARSLLSPVNDRKLTISPAFESTARIPTA